MPDTISLALIAGFVLDLLLGDPRWLPHPVRSIGRLANWAEPRCRRIMANEYLAGALFTMVVVAVAAGGVWIVIWGLQQLHPGLAALGMFYFVYAGLAVGDLAGEATAVWQLLRGGGNGPGPPRLSRNIRR